MNLDKVFIEHRGGLDLVDLEIADTEKHNFLDSLIDQAYEDMPCSTKQDIKSGWHYINDRK